MKILSRYLLRELVPGFFLGLVIFSFLLLADHIFKINDLIIVKKLAPLTAARLFFYQFPFVLTITIPIGLLMAMVLGWGRLKADNEVIAILSSGQSLKRLILLSLLVGFLFSLVLLFLNETLLPSASFKYRTLYTSVSKSHPLLTLDENTFFKIGQRQLYVDKIDRKNKELKGIYIHDNSKEDAKTIVAKIGRWEVLEPDIIALKLEEGLIHHLGRDDKYQILEFTEYTIFLNFSKEKISKSHMEMTYGELKEQIKKEKSPLSNFLKISLYKKISGPFACLSLTLIGVPLGILIGRRQRSLGFGLSLLVVLGYYIFMAGGEILGKKSLISPFFSAWGANLFFAGLGLYLIRRIKIRC